MIRRNGEAVETNQEIDPLNNGMTHLGNQVTCPDNVEIRSVTIAIKMGTSQMSVRPRKTTKSRVVV